VIGRIARAARMASPNAGHRALVDLEHHVPRLVILTQNVDGLHEAAGSADVIDIHGNVFRTLCMACGAPGPVPDWDRMSGAPRCTCGGVLRPDVVLFGELLPPAKVQRVYRELVLGAPDVVIAVGTSALFPYIAEPVHDAATHGRCTVEINPERTLLSSCVRHRLEGPADVVLPALVSAVLRGP
jgi:NAD-dependent deacetylase